jgi:hypothetical protein
VLSRPEPAAGSVIDLRSFTPARGLPARRFPVNIGVVTIVGGGAPIRWSSSRQRLPPDGDSARILGGGHEERVPGIGT